MIKEKTKKKSRGEELKEVFKDVEKKKRGLINPLIEETADLLEKLEDIKKLPLYTIGRESGKIKQTQASKIYTELLAQFNFCIKNLASFIKQEGEEDSPLENFLKTLKEE